MTIEGVLLTAGRIKELRVKSGLSLRKFAKACGIGADMLCRYEAGKALPQIENCRKIINYMMLNHGITVTIEWLRPE